jgi:hypothetical protein
MNDEYYHRQHHRCRHGGLYWLSDDAYGRSSALTWVVQKDRELFSLVRKGIRWPV